MSLLLLEETTKNDGHSHVMPDSGPEHDRNKDCWCEPELHYKDDVTGREVWVHTDVRPSAWN